MATLDIVLLLCFIPGIIRGLSKGILEQALALVGIVVSVWAAFRFSSLVCTWLQPHLEVSETILNVVAFALILIAVSLGVLLLARLLTKVVEMAMLGWLNKALGLLLAIAVNALIVGVVIVLFDTINVHTQLVKPETLDNSVLYTALKNLSYTVFPYLKQLLMKS